MHVQFSEYQPSFPLSQAIQAYWTGDFNRYSENHFVQSVIPNGSIELIIHLTSDHCELIKQDAWENSPEFTLIGLHTGPYTVRFNRQVQVFGIRFNPDGFYFIFGVPPAEFSAAWGNSSDILGKDFAGYCGRMRESASMEDSIKLTEKFLLKRLSRQVFIPDYLHAAPAMIRRQSGRMTMEELFKQVPISPRQLQRAFKKHYGITAKEYMRLARLNAIQKYMRSERVNLTDLGYESGFADQSHFIREFRLLTGINPGGFLKKRDQFIVRV